jgi:hypothetical protein
MLARCGGSGLLLADVAKPCRYEVLPGQDVGGQGDDGQDGGRGHDAVSKASGRQGKSPSKRSRKHKRGIRAEESEIESQEVANGGLNESLDQLLMMHQRLQSVMDEGGGGVREGQEGEEEGDATAAGGGTEGAREEKTRDKKNGAR